MTLPENSTTLLAPLPFILRLCSLSELQELSQVSRDVSSVCEHEWRLRTLLHFGDLRFVTSQWRRCFMLRSQFRRKAVEKVTARIYLMNNQGELRFFSIERGTPLMCSRDRAVIYNRCKKMFDFSLRINRSIQELSTLIGMVSVEEARRLLNEHIGLMTSVAALRDSLNFESELFQIYPAPVLLDTNSLLRVTHTFQEEHDAAFLQSSLLMMQLWVSIDGLIYRPLAPPAAIQKIPDQIQHNQDNRTDVMWYASMKLHELSGMTVKIDDNTLRYRMQGNELCVNALVSNTYLLYLFNPLQYRPLDWTFTALLQVGDTSYKLPVRREGVFLNTKTYALRIFLSYGKLPVKKAPEETRTDDQGQENDVSGKVADVMEVAESSLMKDARGAEDSEPLAIPYNGQHEIFAFHLTATNRISKKTCVVVSNATRLSLVPPRNTVEERLEPQKSSEVSTRQNEEASREESSTTLKDAAPSLERQIDLPFDATICYCFAPSYCLQYVEFAIGFEPLMHLLGVANFLPLVN